MVFFFVSFFYYYFFIVFYVYIAIFFFLFCVINTLALKCVCFSSYPIPSGGWKQWSKCVFSRGNLTHLEPMFSTHMAGSQISPVSFLIPVIPGLFARHHLQSHSEDFTYVCVCRTSVCEGLSAGHTGVIDVDAPPWPIMEGDLETLFVGFICHL